jgi:hypothetical protein
VSFVDQHAAKLFKLVKARDLEGLVVKRKDGKYRPETKWFKVLNPGYTQKAGPAGILPDAVAVMGLSMFSSVTLSGSLSRLLAQVIMSRWS